MKKKEYIQPQTVAVALSQARTLLLGSYNFENAQNASDNDNPVMDAKEHNSNDVNLWDKAWSLFIAFLLLPLWAMAAPVEVTTTAGGQLQEKLLAQSISPTDVDTLTVTGPLNGTDIEYLHRYLTSIKALYLSDAQIVSGGDSYHHWRHSNGTSMQHGSSSYNTAANAVGDYMFANLTNLTALVLPAGVTTIGSYAFANCGSLTNLTIPNGVTSIGNYAFSYNNSIYGNSNVNKLTTLTLPSSLTSLGSYAFYYQKSLQSIDIPASLTAIPNYCFYNSSVQTVTLHEGLTTIGNYAFSNSGLQSLSLPSTLTTLGENAFSSCSSLSGPFTLPAALTSLPTYAFQSCTSLDDVTFSEGLQTIGSSAFYNCQHLTEVQLPLSVTTIRSSAFERCYRLETLSLPSGLTSLGTSAFCDCDSLASFTFPEAITIVPDNVLYGCDKLSSVTLASGTTAIGSLAFNGCAKITAIDLSPYTQLTQINSQAFARTGLVEVELPNRIELGQYCFRYCSKLQRVNIPTAVTALPSYLFDHCTALTDVTLHDGVTEIGYDAFSNCTSLESINLPSGVTDIKGSAFTNCQKLQLATWPSSLLVIGNYAFSGCKALTQANLPAGIKSIGSQAFEGSGVRTAFLPTGITTLDNNIFSNCDSLRTVTWPADQTTVPQCTFQSCDSLKTIALPDAVTSIGTYAFSGCKGLGNNFHFPTSLSSIGYQAFYNTTGLTDIELPTSLTSIGDYAFEGSGLTHIEIPDNVTTLGGYAFQNCLSLTSATLGRNMNYGGNSNFNYFYGCKALCQLRIFAGTPPSINSSSINAYYKDCVLEVPLGTKELYEAATYWKDFKSIITFNTGDKLDATDFAIMQQLYNLWDGANWTHPWDLTNDDRYVGKWHGVSFDGNHIAAINLSGCNLHGPLTQAVFDLPNLTSLDLANNYLTAQLDTVLSDGYTNSRVTRIQLEANMLEGDLSPFAAKFSALTYLNVAHNWLTAISSPISKTTLKYLGSNLYYHRQFCDNKTRLPFVSEDYPAKQVHFGEDLDITWNSLQTYQHSDQNYNRSITSLYRIYYNNSNWTYESSYSFYTYSNNKWAPSTSSVLYPLRDEPMLLSPSTSTDYQTTIVVQFSWDDGDVNADLTVDVLDLQHIVSFAATGSKLSGKVFNFTAADAIADQIIDVRDIVKTIDAILDFEEASSPAAVRPYILYNKRVRASEAAQSNVVAIEGDCLRFANTDAVAALQLTIAGQRADDLMLAPDLRGFALSKRQVGSDTRLVIYNLNGRTIAAGEHDLLMGLDAQAVIADARLTDTEANYLPVSVCDDATPLQTIKGGFTTDADIFDLNGRRIPSLDTAPAGIYVIKKGNKQIKVKI